MSVSIEEQLKLLEGKYKELNDDVTKARETAIQKEGELLKCLKHLMPLQNMYLSNLINDLRKVDEENKQKINLLEKEKLELREKNKKLQIELDYELLKCKSKCEEDNTSNITLQEETYNDNLDIEIKPPIGEPNILEKSVVNDVIDEDPGEISNRVIIHNTCTPPPSPVQTKARVPRARKRTVKPKE